MWELLTLVSPGLFPGLGARSGPGAENTVTLLGTSNQLFFFFVPRKSLSALAFSPDGKYIVTGEVSHDQD
jgi:hypothetical protein